MGYDFMVDTSTGVLPAQSSMTLYRADRLLWLSTTNHQVSCVWIRPKRDHIEKAIRTMKPTDRPLDEYGFRPEMVQRAVGELGRLLFTHLHPFSPILTHFHTRDTGDTWLRAMWRAGCNAVQCAMQLLASVLQGALLGQYIFGTQQCFSNHFWGARDDICVSSCINHGISRTCLCPCASTGFVKARAFRVPVVFLTHPLCWHRA